MLHASSALLFKEYSEPTVGVLGITFKRAPREEPRDANQLRAPAAPDFNAALSRDRSATSKDCAPFTAAVVLAAPSDATALLLDTAEASVLVPDGCTAKVERAEAVVDELNGMMANSPPLVPPLIHNEGPLTVNAAPIAKLNGVLHVAPGVVASAVTLNCADKVVPDTVAWITTAPTVVPTVTWTLADPLLFVCAMVADNAAEPDVTANVTVAPDTGAPDALDT